VSDKTIRVAELFAGVGGFRLALDGYHDDGHPEFDMPPAGPYRTVWANQWEPPGSERKQFAARCYEERFGEESLVVEDIDRVLDAYERGAVSVPDVDLVVGGFPCQDYSVARPLSQAGGIEGRKGVLWWSIYRFLRLKMPRFVLLENVDRLLKSPAKQRGRDFAIMLSCLASLGYSVEWRVVNSAEYGLPQRRKRVYIFGELTSSVWDLSDRLAYGVLAQALPIHAVEAVEEFELPHDPFEISEHFGLSAEKSPFGTAGAMQEYRVSTCDVAEDFRGRRMTLGDVLVPADEVPEEFFVDSASLPRWRYLKGSKSEERTNRVTGFKYHYSEGRMAFPDSLDSPSRTILTGEGGSGPSRFKHVIQMEDGRYRRLVPDELDQLQGFPRGWTNTGMTDGQRAFCMGNALTVGVPHRIGKVIASLHLFDDEMLDAGEFKEDRRRAASVFVTP